MKTLETERLILRKFNIDDAEDMYKNWATDEKTVKYMIWNAHDSVDTTRKIIQKWLDDYEHDGYNWVVELKDTHEIIGNIDAVKIRKEDKNLELGYCYGSKYWGNGYATEALKIVINYLLNECDFYLIEARHLTSNPASGRVMEKSGMKKEAVLRKRAMSKITEELDDIVVYSITKDEL